MDIRPIQPCDDAALAALVRDTLAAHDLAVPGTAYFDPELDHLSAYYAASKRRAYFVAIDRGAIIGGAGIAEIDGSEDLAELQKLYVAKDSRRCGVATKLMDLIESTAAELGYHGIYLETHSNLAAAINLYRTRGYRQIDAPLPGSPHTTMDHFFIKEV